MNKRSSHLRNQHLNSLFVLHLLLLATEWYSNRISQTCSAEQ